jgi:hypothetical protein
VSPPSRAARAPVRGHSDAVAGRRASAAGEATPPASAATARSQSASAGPPSGAAILAAAAVAEAGVAPGRELAAARVAVHPSPSCQARAAVHRCAGEDAIGLSHRSPTPRRAAVCCQGARNRARVTRRPTIARAQVHPPRLPVHRRVRGRSATRRERRSTVARVPVHPSRRGPRPQVHRSVRARGDHHACSGPPFCPKSPTRCARPGPPSDPDRRRATPYDATRAPSERP